jgi:hypothetical protein
MRGVKREREKIQTAQIEFLKSNHRMKNNALLFHNKNRSGRQ